MAPCRCCRDDRHMRRGGVGPPQTGAAATYDGRFRAFQAGEGLETVGWIKRTLQRRVLDPLALRVLEGDFLEGDTIIVDGGPEGLVFEKREAART